MMFTCHRHWRIAFAMLPVRKLDAFAKTILRLHHE
jgi:hypothetical protein